MLCQDRRNWFSEFSRQIFARAEMIYSCLENKTDAKYEVLIFEHFHPSRYLRDERERERKAKYISQMAFSRNVKFPRIFSDARVRGGLLGLNTRGNVTLSLFIYICVYHQGQCPEYCLLGEAATGSQRIWFLRRRVLVRHLLQQSWMYWCVTLSSSGEAGTQWLLCQRSVTLAPAKCDTSWH